MNLVDNGKHVHARLFENGRQWMSTRCAFFRKIIFFFQTLKICSNVLVDGYDIKSNTQNRLCVETWLRPRRQQEFWYVCLFSVRESCFTVKAHCVEAWYGGEGCMHVCSLVLP